MEKSYVTISIPVYNRYTYFKEAIESALKQTVKCKIVVVDNNSEHKKFEEYVNNLKNPLVSYYKNTDNLGMIGNWNRCAEVVDTPWISILHDDDILHPNFIEIVQKVIEKNADFGLVGTRAFVSNYIPESFFRKISYDPQKIIEITSSFFLYRNLSPFPGVAFKKSLFDKVGGFNPSYHPISDLDFWYRLTREERAFFITQDLAFYRISEEQETFSRFAELIEKTKDFRNLIYNENKIDGLLNKLSVMKANQDLIDYYNKSYPQSNLENEKFSFFFKAYPINKILDRITRKNAYKNS